MYSVLAHYILMNIKESRNIKCKCNYALNKIKKHKKTVYAN